MNARGSDVCVSCGTPVLMVATGAAAGCQDCGASVTTLEQTGNIRHHSIDNCDGPPCVFHSPSDHVMREWPMRLRTDWGVALIERVCRHGVGHPDPDCVEWLEKKGYASFSMHSCDGCCGLTSPSDEDVAKTIDDLRRIAGA